MDLSRFESQLRLRTGSLKSLNEICSPLSLLERVFRGKLSLELARVQNSDCLKL